MKDFLQKNNNNFQKRTRVGEEFYLIIWEVKIQPSKYHKYASTTVNTIDFIYTSTLLPRADKQVNWNA